MDGRIDAPDGIGRYTRCAVAAVRAVAPADVTVRALGPTGTPRYGRLEADEIVAEAARLGADVVHVLDYRVPWMGLSAPVVVTLHDVVRLLDPGLCYSDAAFAARFGGPALDGLRQAVADLRALAPPARGARPHPTSLHEEFYARMMAYAAASAAVLVVPTAMVAAQVRATVSATARLRVHPWGSDHLPAVRDPAHRGLILYVGQARPHKRVPAVLDAYARTASRRRGVPLVLVGADFAPGGPGAEQVAGHPAAADTVLLGAVGDGLLAALYRRAYVLVHLATSEGYGFGPLEALAAGAGVVAGDIPTFREVLGSAARLVDPDDPAAAARAIDAVVDGGPGPRPAPQRWRDHGKALVAIYQEVTGGRTQIGDDHASSPSTWNARA
jgi:glycosyltransferase involved in cell wall biosynthesis